MHTEKILFIVVCTVGLLFLLQDTYLRQASTQESYLQQVSIIIQEAENWFHIPSWCKIFSFISSDFNYCARLVNGVYKDILCLRTNYRVAILTLSDC